MERPHRIELLKRNYAQLGLLALVLCGFLGGPSRAAQNLRSSDSAAVYGSEDRSRFLPDVMEPAQIGDDIIKDMERLADHLGLDRARALEAYGQGVVIHIPGTGISDKYPWVSEKGACFSFDTSEDIVSICRNGLKIDTSAHAGSYCVGSVDRCSHENHHGWQAHFVAPQSEIRSYMIGYKKIIDGNEQGTHSHALLKAALEFILQRALAEPEKRHVISLSMGTLWGYDDGEQCNSNEKDYFELIQRLTAAGVVIAAAAGNGIYMENDSIGSVAPSCINKQPSNADGNLSIARLTYNFSAIDQSSGYNLDTHTAAPGSHIPGITPEGKGVYFSGTSFATPYVAGLSALLLSKNSSATPSEVEHRVNTSAQPIIVEFQSNPSSDAVTHTIGSIDIGGAVQKEYVEMHTRGVTYLPNVSTQR